MHVRQQRGQKWQSHCSERTRASCAHLNAWESLQQKQKTMQKKTQSNSYGGRWKLAQLTVSMLMRKDYQCKLSVGHISRTIKLNLLNVPKIKRQIKHYHHTFKCMTTAFVFPTENHIVLWNICKCTLYITEPFSPHKNAPIKILA